MRKLFRILIAVAVAGVFGTQADRSFAQGKTIRLSAGLEASIGFVGRDPRGQKLTVTLRLANRSKSPVQLILAGQPLAIDNAGGSYRMESFAGLTACPRFSIDAASCMGRGTMGRPAPLETYTQIDPGIDITTTISFAANAEPTRATLASLSATLIYRIVQDPIADPSMSEDERMRGLRTMNLSIPDHPITDGR